MNNSKDQERLLRTFNILVSCLDRMQKIRPIRSELLDLTERAVDQFISRSYTLGRVDSCVTVSQIEILIKQMMQGFRFDKSTLDSIHELHLKLLGAWADECRPDLEMMGAVEKETPFLAEPEANNDAQVTQAANESAEQTDILSVEEENPELTGCFEYFLQDEFDLDADLMEIFLADIDEQTADLMNLILEMESGGSDSSSIQSLFRILHTVKGNAGFVGLQEIFKLVHAMEDYIQLFRDKHFDLNQFSYDLMLVGVDVISQLKGNLRKRFNAINTNDPKQQLTPVDWREITAKLIRISADGMKESQKYNSQQYATDGTVSTDLASNLIST